MVRLVENLALEEPAWKVNAVAPGFVATRSTTRRSRPARSRRRVPRRDGSRLEEAVPPKAAAALVAFLLSDESQGISGRLISAVWDDWRTKASARFCEKTTPSVASAASIVSSSTPPVRVRLTT